LYDLMKVEDQKELDQLYGTKADGTSKKIRAANGDIIDR